MYSDKDGLINLMLKESEDFQYLFPKSNLHLDWDDGLIFLYLLHSIIVYDNKRKNEAIKNGSFENYFDLLSLILAMRVVGIKLELNPKSGIRIIYSKLWNDKQELDGWRQELGRHNQFLISTFSELGKLFNKK